MKKFTALSLTLIFATLSMSILPSGANAATEVRIARLFGLGYLPTMIMEHEGFFEKQAAALGVHDVKVTWPQLGSAAAMNDAILSGSLDFASGALTAPIIVWDRTKGTSSEVMAVCGESVIPFTLFTNKPDIKTVKDFRPGEQIAMTAVKVTTYAILLQMAAAKEFGDKNYAKLDPLTVSMPHPAAVQALFNGQIAGHFTWPPYSYAEAEHAGIHKVIDSTEILGGQPMSSTVIWARKKFHDQHPKLYKAFLNAMKQSVDFIKNNKETAAKIYESMTNSKQPILKMLQDPNITFDLAPHGAMKFATFLHQIGTIKSAPTSWKDMYFPEVHDLNGD
jgi:NitT/TauT family transport system substrate-binding protein